MTEPENVRLHYEPAEAQGLAGRVTQVLDGMGAPVTARQLAGLDQFHVGGLAATAELGRLLGLKADEAVLDAGSGLGGPSRFFAETYGCRLTGVDLTPSFVDVARLLAERTGLGARVSYEVGDLTALTLPDAAFDAAYTQHVAMNIRDRAGLYGQIRRVLKHGGRFGFYDVLAVEGAAEPIYPVPWAETPATSALLTEPATRAVLLAAGLTPLVWNDATRQATEWTAQQAASATGPTLGLVMGPRMAAMVANLRQNFEERRLRIVMGVCEAV